MEQLRKIIAQISAQLRDMTLSQRLALFLGTALVVVSIVWMVQWAAEPKMVPLLDQPLNPEQLATMRTALEGMQEPFEIERNQVFVRASANRSELLASLQQSEALPTDVSIGFAKLVEASNPWISEKEGERRWTVALQNQLEGVLRSFDGVRSASVFLNINAKRTLVARHEIPATASVRLEMKGGEPVPRSLAVAAARLVAGAGGNLKTERVEVVDNRGRLAIDWGAEEDGSPSNLYRQQLKREREMAAKILSQLPDPNAHVNVSIDLEHITTQTTTDEPLAGVESMINSESTETTRTLPGGDPGVRPNTAAATTTTGVTERSTQSSNTTELEVGRKHVSELKPSGDVENVFAAISLSESYLEALFRKSNPDAAAVTLDDLETVFGRQQERIERQVRVLVRAQSADQATPNVDVTWHIEDLVEPQVVTMAGADGALGYLQRFGPQAGLMGLALLALGLMFRLARKTKDGESFGMEIGLPEDAIEAARRAAADVEDAAGRAQRRAAQKAASAAAGPRVDEGYGSQATEGVLVAQEVDESTVQVSKMVDQVQKFVDQDPETVANMFERWMEDDI